MSWKFAPHDKHPVRDVNLIVIAKNTALLVPPTTDDQRDVLTQHACDCENTHPTALLHLSDEVDAVAIAFKTVADFMQWTKTVQMAAAEMLAKGYR